MRRSVGLDLNGWYDFGCRDWRIDESDEKPGAPECVDGGFGSVVVEHDGDRVGGPQAVLSPIGRGYGWGSVGPREKRRGLAEQWRTFLEGKPHGSFAGDICAAADALSVQADDLVVCMPDRIDMSEARQQALLIALTGLRRPRVTLLWRPVALLLDLLDRGALSDPVEGQRVLCLIHGHDGFEVQRLVLRRLTERPGHLAPERAGPGTLHCRDLGLTRLLAHATAAVADANPQLADRPAESPRLPFNLLFQVQDPFPEEVIRRDNATWTLVRAPIAYHLPDLPRDLGISVTDADIVVLMSPLAPRHRQILADSFADRMGGVTLVLATPEAAARGALGAARRIERNIPHYLDRLDQISLAVLRKEGPSFEDLIPANATVPGNREYISVPITSMVWTAGMSQANFYIRKGPTEIRHWVTPPVEAPANSERLEIRLRQMPAQGWAKLLVTSPSWDVLRRTPIHLDWGALPIDPRTEAEILATLERPRPVVPERVRYVAHAGLWDGSLRQPGLRATLQSLDVERPASLKMFADALSASFRMDVAGAGSEATLALRVYPVGTDGDLPEGLDAATKEQFYDAIDRVGTALLRDIARPGARLDNNHALRCLTWAFALCPRDVQRELVGALDAIRSSDGLHALLTPLQSARVVVHGLGRVVTDAEMLRLLIPKLYADIERPNFLAALSSMLSRPRATPHVLTDGDVEAIGTRVVQIFRTLIMGRKFGVLVKYALMAVAGLLRVRERAPWALVAEDVPLARSLVEVLSAVSAQIQSMPNAIPNEAQKLQITRELIALLSGNGGRPDILTMVDAMAEE